MNSNNNFYDPYSFERENNDEDEVDDFDDFIEKNNSGTDYYAILNVSKNVMNFFHNKKFMKKLNDFLNKNIIITFFL